MSYGMLKGIAVFLVASISGFYVGIIYSALNNDYMIVDIVDLEQCNIVSATIFVNSKEISKTIEEFHDSITLDVRVGNNFPMEYRVEINTKNCGVFKPDKRTIESGWKFFEKVKKQEVIHEVR